MAAATEVDRHAWIFFIDGDGVLHKNLISENFEDWASPPSWGTVGRFVSVTQGGGGFKEVNLDAEWENRVGLFDLVFR